MAVKLPDRIAEYDDLIIYAKIIDVDANNYVLLPLAMNKTDTYRHLINYMSSGLIEHGGAHPDSSLDLDSLLETREIWPVFTVGFREKQPIDIKK